MPLPIDGQTGWGDILNAFLNTLQTQANTTQTNLNSHAANTPSDPHGDRSYAQSLVNPIINGVNLPNGFVQLNSSGTIPSNLISGSGSTTGGAYNGIFDCVATYGATAGTGSDQSVKIQNALNAAGTAKGGLVWLGPGVFSLANYIVIPNNTWFMMSQGTTLARIPGSPNAPYMITNVQFGTSNTPATNIRITGGTVDAVGSSSLTSACTPIFLIQSNGNLIENVYINNVFNNPAIEINGCNNTVITTCIFDGTGTNNFFGTSTTPAVRINVSTSSTTPSGLANTFYNNTITNNCHLTNSATQPPNGLYGCYGALIGSDLVFFPYKSDHIFVLGCATEYTSKLGTGSNAAIFSNNQWSSSSNSANLFFESNP